MSAQEADRSEAASRQAGIFGSELPRDLSVDFLDAAEQNAEEERTPPTDSSSRVRRLSLAALGLASLIAMWVCIAILRDHALKRLAGSSGKAASGLVATKIHAVVYQSNTLVFIGISCSLVILGVLIAAFTTDPVGEMREIVHEHEREARQHYEAACESFLDAARREMRLYSLERLTPARMRVFQAFSETFACHDGAERASNDPARHGHWSKAPVESHERQRPLFKVHEEWARPDGSAEEAASPAPGDEEA